MSKLPNRLYVIVRDDLEFGGMAAQSGHAVAQYMLEYDDWENEYLIFLKTNERKLERLEMKLNRKEIPYSRFHEPDLQNQRTAIAVLNHKEMFKGLPLL